MARCTCVPRFEGTDWSQVVDAQVVAVRHKDTCPARAQRVATLSSELHPEVVRELLCGIAEALKS